MNNKKTGIITLHKNINYGANLQAFATCKFLNDNDVPASVIDYLPEKQDKENHFWSLMALIIKNEPDKSVKRMIKLILSLCLIAPSKIRRLYKFNKFRKNNMHLTKYCKDLSDIVKQNYDTIVCGSDQIWNADITRGIDPVYYGESVSDARGPIQPLRDALEFRLFEAVIATEKPILAICRGAQLVNVALGGTLYQDIPSELDTWIAHRQSEAKCSPSHAVSVLSDTPLERLIGTVQMTANSFHHQAVKRLGRDLSVMALAEDGIIEAFFLKGTRYLRAYQWHPERLFEADAQNRMIFSIF